jgi:hypothetical protein
MAQQTCRLQIDVRPGLMARFCRLLDLGELTTPRELLDTSVTVLEWAVNQRLNGRVVGSIDEASGIFRELHMPYLETCHAKAAAPRGADAVRSPAGKRVLSSSRVNAGPTRPGV